MQNAPREIILEPFCHHFIFSVLSYRFNQFVKVIMYPYPPSKKLKSYLYEFIRGHCSSICSAFIIWCKSGLITISGSVLCRLTWFVIFIILCYSFVINVISVIMYVMVIVINYVSNLLLIVIENC
jgi:hypothetical protein